MRNRVLVVIGSALLLAPLSPVAFLGAVVLAAAMRATEPLRGDENW